MRTRSATVDLLAGGRVRTICDYTLPPLSQAWHYSRELETKVMKERRNDGGTLPDMVGGCQICDSTARNEAVGETYKFGQTVEEWRRPSHPFRR